MAEDGAAVTPLPAAQAAASQVVVIPAAQLTNHRTGPGPSGPTQAAQLADLTLFYKGRTFLLNLQNTFCLRKEKKN